MKSVNPTNASPSQPSTFTYTITVGNQDDEPENLKKIYDGLPVGFSYVTGSTTGVTTNDPSINIYQSESGGTTYEQLTWNLAPLGITLQPSEVASLTFNTTATAPQGVYCNEVWVDPGGQKTSSGPTAKITIGSPSNTLCGGEAVSVTKSVVPRLTPSDTLTTYTYTITIDNIGTASLGMSQLRDLLPAGFSYKVGSTSGDITLVDPHTTLFQGRERLDWDFSPSLSIPSGVIKTVSFDVEAQVAAGDYWNEVWATFDELTYSAYTWPTSSIEVMGVLKSSATGGDTLVYAEVWVGTSSYIVDQWELNR
ncbi:MAG: DUF11 domain-containing protein [Chloroflexi bacterium]|nr:DUF11 domain-containing protein [Chloroflexota bacterium]